jgi:hypothetical protein
MKWTIQLALIATTSLAPLSGAVAQSLAKASIPFDFTVQRTTMPAGEYVVETIQSGAINLHSTDWKYHEISLVNTGVEPGISRDVLVFDRFGDHYFLKEIRLASNDVRLQLPVSKAEKKAQSTEASLRKVVTTEIALK